MFRITHACIAGFLLATRVASGQCPDGTPPPCGKSARANPPNPRRVVVAPFTNLTGDRDLDPIGQIASEWISSGLSELDSLEVVSATAAIAEAQGIRAGSAASAALALAQRARAGSVVMGSYYSAGEHVRVQAQLLDVSSGRVRRSFDPVLIARADPVPGLTPLRERVLTELSGGGRVFRMTTKPPLYPAYREFVEGMRFARETRYREAVPYFHRALALDSSFIPPYSYLASSYFNLSNPRAMDSVLILGIRHGSDAGNLDRQYLDWMNARLHRDNEGELRALRSMAARDSSFDAIFLAGWSGVRANHLHKARAAFELLERRGRVSDSWLQYWGWYSATLHLLGDHVSELRVITRGRARYPMRSTFISGELRARAAMGQIDRVRLLADTVERTMVDSANTVADIMLLVAEELVAHGRRGDAKGFYDRTVRLRTTALRNRNTADNAHLLANALYDAGRLDSAGAVARASADTSQWRTCLGALIDARLGDTTAARSSLAILEHETGGYERHDSFICAARVRAVLNEPAAAVVALQKALQSGAVYGHWLHRTPELMLLRDHPAFVALMRPRDAAPPSSRAKSGTDSG